MQILKQSTATTIYVGPVLDSAGAAVTTAVVGDFRIVKNGTAATLSGATVTHDANGYYTIALTTSNTDTVGRLTLAVGNTAMAMATHRYTVLLASVFDALLTNATNSTGGLVTATAAITGLSGVIATTTNITSAVGIVLAATTHTGATIPTVTTVTNRVSANTDQWGGVAVTGMPMPTYTQPAGFLAATFPATVASTTNITTVGAVSGSVGSVTGNVGGSVGSISGVTFPGNFGSLAITVGGAVTVGTVSDKTGYTLASNGLASITAWTVAITGNITGNLSGSVGSVTGAVGSVASGVTVATNNDKSGYSLATAPLDASGTAAAVWGALLTSYTTAGTFGARVVRSTNSNNSVAITGANHVAADIHELQPSVITAADFATGAIDANALAADAASKVAAAVRTNLATELGRIDVASSTLASQSSVNTLTTYVDTEVAAIKAKTDALPANPAATSDIPSAITIADAVLSRSVANVETTAGEHTLCTLVLAALEGAISGTTWTIKRTNGSTTHYVKTVTADANAAPIVSVQ